MGRKRTLLVEEDFAVLQRAHCGSPLRMRRSASLRRSSVRSALKLSPLLRRSGKIRLSPPVIAGRFPRGHACTHAWAHELCELSRLGCPDRHRFFAGLTRPAPFRLGLVI